MCIKFLKTVILTGLLVCLLEPVSALAKGDQSSEDNKPTFNPPMYVIQPNDLLEIVVWEEPEISRTVRVRPDGRISLPLIQDLQASELTPVDLKKQMENLLE